MTHQLILAYGLYRKMEVYVSYYLCIAAVDCVTAPHFVDIFIAETKTMQ